MKHRDVRDAIRYFGRASAEIFTGTIPGPATSAVSLCSVFYSFAPPVNLSRGELVDELIEPSDRANANDNLAREGIDRIPLAFIFHRVSSSPLSRPLSRNDDDDDEDERYRMQGEYRAYHNYRSSDRHKKVTRRRSGLSVSRDGLQFGALGGSSRTGLIMDNRTRIMVHCPRSVEYCTSTGPRLNVERATFLRSANYAARVSRRGSCV